MFKITVFTPTYNRAYILDNLYNNLKEQTYRDFEWLIVDDGSNDNTKELVDKFIDENKINIRYMYKENGGKHTAINKGIVEARGELFFIVDSDDGLVTDALEVINNKWNSLDNKEGFCGLVGLCIDKEGQIIGTDMPDDINKCYFTDLYYKYGVKGDKSLVLLTDILKKYPFPERQDVKFIPESIVWHEISKQYKVICFNEPLIIREYLEDGLTNNIFSKSSLRGRAVEYLYLINQNTYPLGRYPYMWVKNYINLARYSLLSDSKYFNEIIRPIDKTMYILCYPLGYFKYNTQRNLVKK
jgi:glycosyltransferase involved in cell wall biosynthesis